MEDAERLRRYSVNDAELFSSTESEQHSTVFTKELCLARLSALVALSASDPSVRSEVDAAVSAGASSTEIIAMLEALLPVVGRPKIVTAAPNIALALGYDTELLGSGY